MGLPKNFQQTLNLTKRVKALNDLTFYLFEYEVTLTEKIIKEIYDDTFIDFEKLSMLGNVKFLRNKKAECKHRVSALDREKADNKFNDWLNKAIVSGIITEFKIIRVTEKSFADELEDQNLMDILNFKGD